MTEREARHAKAGQSSSAHVAPPPPGWPVSKPAKPAGMAWAPARL